MDPYGPLWTHVRRKLRNGKDQTDCKEKYRRQSSKATTRHQGRQGLTSSWTYGSGIYSTHTTPQYVQRNTLQYVQLTQYTAIQCTTTQLRVTKPTTATKCKVLEWEALVIEIVIKIVRELVEGTLGSSRSLINLSTSSSSTSSSSSSSCSKECYPRVTRSASSKVCYPQVTPDLETGTTRVVVQKL